MAFDVENAGLALSPKTVGQLLLTLLSGWGLAVGCARSECLRHTDCDNGYECHAGACTPLPDEDEAGEAGAPATTQTVSGAPDGSATNAGAAGAAGAP